MFKPGQSGNPNGRPKRLEGDKPTNRELKERELLMLLRKIKPLVSESIMTAAKIMRNDEASHQNQLKAAVVLLDNYRKLALDLYDGEDADAEGTAVQDNAPVFSLRMVGNEEDNKVGT